MGRSTARPLRDAPDARLAAGWAGQPAAVIHKTPPACRVPHSHTPRRSSRSPALSRRRCTSPRVLWPRACAIASPAPVDRFRAREERQPRFGLVAIDRGRDGEVQAAGARSAHVGGRVVVVVTIAATVLVVLVLLVVLVGDVPLTIGGVCTSKVASQEVVSCDLRRVHCLISVSHAQSDAALRATTAPPALRGGPRHPNFGLLRAIRARCRPQRAKPCDPSSWWSILSCDCTAWIENQSAEVAPLLDYLAFCNAASDSRSWWSSRAQRRRQPARRPGPARQLRIPRLGRLRPLSAICAASGISSPSQSNTARRPEQRLGSERASGVQFHTWGWNLRCLARPFRT